VWPEDYRLQYHEQGNSKDQEDLPRKSVKKKSKKKKSKTKKLKKKRDVRSLNTSAEV